MLLMAGAPTGASMATVGDLTVEPGRRPVYHSHPNTEESIVIVEGVLALRLGMIRLRSRSGVGVGGSGGGSSAETVTRNVTWVPFPAASVAVQVTVVSPTGKTLPEAGTHTTVGVGSAASVTTGSG